MQKIGKIIVAVYTILFILLTASSLYDAIKRDRFEGAVITVAIFSLPYFFYFWVRLYKASLRNYLKKFASYDDKALVSMSMGELENRRKLYRLDKEKDHRDTLKEELGLKIKEIIEFKKSQPSALKQFMDGFNSASGGAPNTGFVGSSKDNISSSSHKSGYTMSAELDVKRLEQEVETRKLWVKELSMGIKMENSWEKGMYAEMLAESEKNLAEAKRRLAQNLTSDSYR